MAWRMCSAWISGGIFAITSSSVEGVPNLPTKMTWRNYRGVELSSECNRPREPQSTPGLSSRSFRFRRSRAQTSKLMIVSTAARNHLDVWVHLQNAPDHILAGLAARKYSASFAPSAVTWLSLYG